MTVTSTLEMVLDILNNQTQRGKHPELFLATSHCSGIWVDGTDSDAIHDCLEDFPSAIVEDVGTPKDWDRESHMLLASVDSPVEAHEWAVALSDVHVRAYVKDITGYSGALHSGIVDTVTRAKAAYMGTYDSKEEWAYQQIEDRWSPEIDIRYFDAVAYVHDAECSGELTFSEGWDGEIYVFTNR